MAMKPNKGYHTLTTQTFTMADLQAEFVKAEDCFYERDALSLREVVEGMVMMAKIINTTEASELQDRAYSMADRLETLGGFTVN